MCESHAQLLTCSSTVKFVEVSQLESIERKHSQYLACLILGQDSANCECLVLVVLIYVQITYSLSSLVFGCDSISIEYFGALSL